MGINFGIGESAPNLFLHVINLYLCDIWSMVNLEWTHCVFIVLCFAHESWPIVNKKCISSPNFIFAVVNLYWIVLEKSWTDGESLPNDFDEKVNSGEDLRGMSSICWLMAALVSHASKLLHLMRTKLVFVQLAPKTVTPYWKQKKYDCVYEACCVLIRPK